MANKITIVAGHIKAVPEEVAGKEGTVYTKINKQEMFGAGDVKAYQTMLDEIEAQAETEDDDNG